MLLACVPRFKIEGAPTLGPGQAGGSRDIVCSHNSCTQARGFSRRHHTAHGSSKPKTHMKLKKCNQILQTVSLLHEMHTYAGPNILHCMPGPQVSFPFRYQCFFYKTNTYFSKINICLDWVYSVEKVNLFFPSFTIFYANTEVTK